MGADHPFEKWFSADELELCPDCGERQLVPPSPTAAMRLCLACGVVPKPESVPRATVTQTFLERGASPDKSLPRRRGGLRV
jgi:hypothetical protein